MSDKPRLLFHSNAPWAGTGYGQQTALFATRLKEHYDLTLSAFYGLEGNIIPWNGIPVLPGIAGDYGNETIEEHVARVFGDYRDGTVMTLMDAWPLDPHTWAQFNTCAWVPVDHDPAPDPVLDFFVNSAAIPIAMSRFGEERLAELDPLYVPHAVDTKVYKPIDRAEARKSIGMDEDCFVVGMVAANKGNPSRKCFAEAFRAFKAFHAKHPDAKLYLHSEVRGRFQGVHLIKLLKSVGVPEEALILCDQYRAVHFPFQPDVMANVFSSMDVLLNASAGEGFGIPVIEAQACGTPVIVSDFSAQPELVGAGWCVEGDKTYTPIGSWQFRPSVEDITEALNQAYRETRNPALAEKARSHALAYDADLVFVEHMLPALERAQDRLTERQPLELAA